jgi:hypothetical protein
MEKLLAIQTELKAPKGQWNDFGKYHYRAAEDILEAVKPMLKEQGVVIFLSDTLELIGDRYYVKATASAHLVDGPTRIEVTAYAREEDTKKGMDGSQITGAASSYARKYALNGLLLIDDNKDSDATNDHGKAPAKAAAPRPQTTNTAPAAGPFPKKPLPAKPAGGVNPQLRDDMRDMFRKKQVLGDAATVFAQNILGKPTPTTDAEAQKLIDELSKLED